MAIKEQMWKVALTGIPVLALTFPAMLGTFVTASASGSPAAIQRSSEGVEPAGPACGGLSGCSEIINKSGRDLRIARDWCGSGRILREYPCEGSESKHPKTWQSPGEKQKWEDTDVFGIIAGCKAHVTVYDEPIGTWWSTDLHATDGKNLWFRVNNPEEAVVDSYKC